MLTYETTMAARRPLTNVFGLLGSAALALAIQSFGWPQAVTGVLINALLLTTAMWLGLPQAILLGMVTPLGAALRGVLPLPMVVMIPFVALGNAVLVSVFMVLRNRNRAWALVAGAVAKFVLLYGSVTVLQLAPLTLVTGTASSAVAIPAALAQMMSWPQLATALVGGMLALGVVFVSNRLSRSDK
ncbi:MAG: ECF transporter S component [Anaerolineae bacterium]